MPPSNDQRQADPRQDPAPLRPPRGGPALPPPEPATQQRASAAFFLALVSVAGLFGIRNFSHGVYVVLYGLLAGCVALWLAITSLVRARRGGRARPRGSRAAIVVAGLGIALSVVILAAFALLGKQLSSYGQCLSGANTLEARQSCQTQFTHAVNRELAVLRQTGRG